MFGTKQRYRWLVVLLGGAVGGLIGLIAAVNLVIYSGVEGGYEANLGDVFAHSALVGVAVVALPVGGMVAGVIVALRRRQDGEHSR